VNVEPPSDKKLPDGPPSHGPTTPSPRAFATATGMVFQTAGTVFLLGACCFWSFSGRLVPRIQGGFSSWTDLFTLEHAPAMSLLAGLVTTFVGGIALITVGVGLTGEKRRSGTLAMWISLIMALIYWALSGVLSLAVGTIGAGVVAALFAIVSTILFLLAGHSATVLKQFPPPPDQGTATEEILEEFRRKRAERLEKYDP